MKALVCFPVLLLAATPAFAEPIVATAPRGDTESVAVSYADLNLDSADGLARLDSRLRSAARMVCDVRPEPESLLREQATARCFRSALAKGREAGRELIAARASGVELAALGMITVSKP